MKRRRRGWSPDNHAYQHRSPLTSLTCHLFLSSCLAPRLIAGAVEGQRADEEKGGDIKLQLAPDSRAFVS